MFIDFINKPKNYNFTFKDIDKDKLARIVFTKITSIPFIWIVVFSISSLLTQENMCNFITIVYITQIPVSYINNFSYQLFFKFLNANMFDLKIIKNKLYIIKYKYTIDFSLYNNNVAYKVNVYSLLSRLIMIYMWNLNPILFIITILFVGLIISCYRYYPIKFISSPIPIPGGKPLEASITKSTGITLGLGTLVWSSIENCDSDSIDPVNNLAILKHSNIGKQTLFEIKSGNNTKINSEDINLIEKSKILNLLRKVNIEKEDFFDETVEEESISTNVNDGTVLAYKKFNKQTSCAVVYRSDIQSSSYYPTYYTNKGAVSNLHQFLHSKLLINPDKTNNVIVFTQKINIGDSMYKVWRVSPEYDSFLFKFDKHIPKPAYFILPREGTSKINEHNTHFDSLEVVNGLNHCLEENNKHLFSLESQYSGVFTEYLYYAKLPTQILAQRRGWALYYGN